MDVGPALVQQATVAPRCPACNADGSTLVDSIPTAELAGLYRSRGIDVDAYFAATPVIHRFRCTSCDLGYFSPPCPGDDLFYEQLQTQAWYYQDAKPEYEYARQYVHDADRVLEVGCGKGAFQAFLPPGARYRGLEFNDEAVHKATSAGLDVRKQSIEEHAAACPGHYDVVCSFQVLEHVPTPASFAHACVQALAPGGRLVIAVPAEDSFLAVAANAPLNMPPHHVLRWSDQALRKLAQREQLQVDALWHEPIASFHQDWQQQTLAQHYFVLQGLNRTRLIDHSLPYRLIGRVLRNRWLRDTLARRVARKQPALRNGHTVVLVASKAAQLP
jgi:SAM-dependent methyltransferase